MAHSECDEEVEVGRQAMEAFQVGNEVAPRSGAGANIQSFSDLSGGGARWEVGVGCLE
jgi:hypothetical protein